MLIFRVLRREKKVTKGWRCPITCLLVIPLDYVWLVGYDKIRNIHSKMLFPIESNIFEYYIQQKW